METDFLEEIGLSKKTAKVYLTLLELNSCLASSIAEKTKINRSTVYDALKELIEKGFANYVIKENRKYFSAVQPEKILELLKEKELKLKNKIPELKKLAKPSEEEIIVEIYKGKEGLKTILEDILKTSKDIFTLGWKGELSKYLEFYFPNWERKRIKLGIKRKALINYEARKKIKKEKLTEFRILPKKINFPSTSVIYKNKIMITISLEETPTMILIKSKKIAETYRSYFNLMWKISA